MFEPGVEEGTGITRGCAISGGESVQPKRIKPNPNANADTVGNKNAQVAAALPPSTARLEVPVTSFDFGYVPQGSSISHTFWLKNVGLDTLRIADVRPG